MGNRIERDAVSFITNLTDANAAEIQEYIAEIRLNREFHNRMEENRRAHSRRRYSSWDFGIGITLGVVLYAICRRRELDTVVETGVASGVSSSHILSALEKNKHGQL